MRATRYRLISFAVVAVSLAVFFGAGALLPAGKEDYRQRSENRESGTRYPQYSGRVPLGERITDTKEATGDLLGNIAADRPLTLADRDYIIGLTQYLIDKRNSWVRRGTAADWLGHFGHRLAIPALLAVLRDETEKRDVRLRCAQALSMIRDPRVVDYLIEDVLGKDFDTTFMQDILFDLAQFVGGPEELKTKTNISGFKYPPEDEEELKRYLQTWNQWWEENRDNKTMNRKYRGSF